jgi:CubicO group peptidase (beta-lactamase class C family)
MQKYARQPYRAREEYPVRAQRRLLLCLLVIVLSAVGVAAAAPSDAGSHPAPLEANAKVDAIFKAWNTPSTPGASVAVIEQGRIVFEKGYGIANLEYDVPIKPDTVFHVASVSKQFTAMAVVLLELDGKLSLDDDVHKYLPELPDYGSRITIRNLLQHTSGLRDQWQTLGIAGWRLDDVITQGQIQRLLFRQKELNFPPGTRYLYSNSGFTLLAQIVARVSGKPFPQFCAERIFGPLGMRHTHFHEDLTQLVPGRAYSYRADGNGYAAAPLNYANVGATSLFTTADDLVVWLDNFRDPKVGGAPAVARMQQAGVLQDGTKIGYGLGIELGMYRGLRTISHSGGDAGYRSEVVWFPDQQLGVAVLSNLASFNPQQSARRVAAVYIGDQMQPEATGDAVEPQYTTVDPKELEQFTGVYPLPNISQTLHVVVERGKLWAAGPVQPPLEIHPVGPAHFYIKERRAKVEFSPRADGGMGVKITQPGAVNEGERITAAAAKVEADLLAYTGVYWSDELETEYTFFLRDGTLYSLHPRHGAIPLVPTIRDQFSSGWWFAPTVTFQRNSQNAVAGVTLGGGRVTGIAFARKPGEFLQKAALVSDVPHTALAAVVGRYDYRGPVLAVTEEDGHVFAQLGLQRKFEIFPKSDHEFFWKVVNAQVAFVQDAAGKVVSATHTQNGRTFSAPRLQDVVDVKLDDSQIDPLLGDYASGPSVRTISREGDRLYSQVTGQPKFELGASSATEFFVKQWNAQMTVVRDESGRATSLIWHQNGKDEPWLKATKP